MLDDAEIREWFRREVLPLEGQLTHFIRHNWRVEDDVMDLRHDVYELVIAGARQGLPLATRPYMFVIARNHLINRAKRARIVSFELVADLELVDSDFGLFDAERHLGAREALRRVQEGLAKLTPRVRQIVQLRKIEGLNIRETAERLGIGSDAVRQQTSIGMRALTDHMLGGGGGGTARVAPPDRRETGGDA
ncbi:RNA polymerase sigma factor [Sphingobium lignivorans]|uniref:RNA polymerase sigma-70 factor (ECF subfamily) n=1 Tax=Sphingobium lignivorans TaxID=2735886 RepID=A0ABR6NKP9_9SPHN|nr:RNA polymerase sigma factor [Sphingobium lignivorans]MBB5986739.1 RNA polymerase sigma-70 factor (ECF subfamily) [Sphingobium lignivorans]